MRQLLLFIMVFLVVCCNKKINVEIENTLTLNYNIEKGGYLPPNVKLGYKENIMVSPSQFEDCFKIIMNKNEFYISIDENIKIRSIFT